jgi:hypothetical protein
MAKEEPKKRKLTEEEIEKRLTTYLEYAKVIVTPHVTPSERGVELTIEEVGRPLGGDEDEFKRLRYATAGFKPVMMQMLLDLLQQVNRDVMQDAFDYVLKCIKLSPNYNGEIPQIYYLGKPISSGQAIVNSSPIYKFAIEELSQRLERLGIPHAVDIRVSSFEKNERQPESQSESQKTFKCSNRERVKKIHTYLVETGVIEQCDYEDFFVWVKNGHFPMDIIQVKIKLKFYYAMEQISSLIIDEFKDWKKSVLTDGQWDTLSSNKAKIEKRWLRYFP